MKADDKFEAEEGTKEKFTNFELLEKEVKVLEDQLDEIVEILKYNDIERKKTIEPRYFDMDRVFRELEDEE